MGQAGRPREVPAGDEGGRSLRAQFDRANDELRRIQSAEVAARTEVSRSRETNEETAGVAAHSDPASRSARPARARKASVAARVRRAQGKPRGSRPVLAPAGDRHEGLVRLAA